MQLCVVLMKEKHLAGTISYTHVVFVCVGKVDKIVHLVAGYELLQYAEQ